MYEASAEPPAGPAALLLLLLLLPSNAAGLEGAPLAPFPAGAVLD